MVLTAFPSSDSFEIKKNSSVESHWLPGGGGGLCENTALGGVQPEKTAPAQPRRPWLAAGRSWSTDRPLVSPPGGKPPREDGDTALCLVPLCSRGSPDSGTEVCSQFWHQMGAKVICSLSKRRLTVRLGTNSQGSSLIKNAF